MFSRFIIEEKGQSALEYILIAGGIIIAAIVIFTSYSRMVRSGGNKIEAATGSASTSMQTTIEAA